MYTQTDAPTYFNLDQTQVQKFTDETMETNEKEVWQKTLTSVQLYST